MPCIDRFIYLHRFTLPPTSLPSPDYRKIDLSRFFAELKFQPYAHAEFVVVMIAVSQQAFITDKRLQAIRKHCYHAHKHIAVIAIRSVVVVIKSISRAGIVTHEGKINGALVILEFMHVIEVQLWY